MIERQRRLKEVYKHLRQFWGIHTQIGFADSIQYSRSVISSALNGNEDYLTDNLFTNICEAYKNVFNLDYLLTGNGQLLTPEEELKCHDIKNGRVKPDAGIVSDDHPAPFIPSWADAFFDIMTQQIKDNEALNRELRQSIAQVDTLRHELVTLINQLKKIKY